MKTRYYKGEVRTRLNKRREVTNMNSVYLEAIDSPKEIDQLHDLIKMVWRQYYGPLMGEGKVERFLALKQSKAMIQKAIDDETSHYFFIYSELTKEVVGYLAYHVENKKLVIDKLYLIYTMRGQGISHDIFAYFEELVAKKNLNGMETWINEENKQGAKIFTHYNFVHTDSRRTPLDQGYVLKENHFIREM